MSNRCTEPPGAAGTDGSGAVDFVDNRIELFGHPPSSFCELLDIHLPNSFWTSTATKPYRWLSRAWMSKQAPRWLSRRWMSNGSNGRSADDQRSVSRKQQWMRGLRSKSLGRVRREISWMSN